MYPFLSTLIFLTLGSICSYTAKQRGRHPTAWFFVGVLFGFLGLLCLYLLPSRKKIALPSNVGTPAVIVPQTDWKFAESSSSLPKQGWFYLDEANQQYGPMSLEGLKRAWSEQKASETTYVWNETMTDWQSVQSLSDLLSELTTP